jgi:EAL domain-containing protein (putative c-di-GMP-specific phosphodiesterase class I)
VDPDAFDRALGSLDLHYAPIVNSAGSVVGYDTIVSTSVSTPSTLGQLYEAASHLRRVGDLGGQIRAAVARSRPKGDVLVPVDPRELCDERLGSNDDPLLAVAASVILKVSGRAPLPSGAIERASELRRKGYRIALDGFGTGYASLVPVRQLALDVVTIPSCLVRGLDQSTDAHRIAAATINLLITLGILPIAEGVETQGERDALARLGCDLTTSGRCETLD